MCDYVIETNGRRKKYCGKENCDIHNKENKPEKQQGRRRNEPVAANSNNPGPNNFDKKLLTEVEKIGKLSVDSEKASTATSGALPSGPVKKDKAKSKPKAKPKTDDESEDDSAVQQKSEPTSDISADSANKDMFKKSARLGGLRLLEACEAIALHYKVNICGVSQALSTNSEFGDLMVEVLREWSPSVAEGVQNSPTSQLLFVIGTTVLGVYSANKTIESAKMEMMKAKLERPAQPQPQQQDRPVQPIPQPTPNI